MTATPHKGDPENFRFFLSLLDRDVYGDVKSLEEAMRRKARSRPRDLPRASRREQLNKSCNSATMPPLEVMSSRLEIATIAQSALTSLVLIL